ncbi:MAG: NADPH-dependent 7-cyano-7-deazaguanine reductase QueF [Chitinispirillaceae bacterium]|nr:NADPH-dependent 7-cyano-7-deazaguanine reductase QueF [Chitinispirillaceae bacterium]
MSANTLLLEKAVEQNILPPLDTFPCPYDAALIKSGTIRIVFPEFTCVCPKTGYPDFARITLLYFPDTLCLELKSWKLYLNAFRNVGAFHEAVTAHLFRTLTTLLLPQWLLITGDFFPRGNVDTTIVFESSTRRPAGADILLERFDSRRREFE